MLRDLIRTYGPRRTPVEPEATSGAEQARHTVMHFDLPGYNDETWKAEYWPASGPRNARSPSLAGSARTSVHPFVVEVPGTGDGARYELVLQYWLF